MQHLGHVWIWCMCFYVDFFFQADLSLFKREHQPTYCKLSASFTLLYCGQIIYVHGLCANAQSCDITSHFSLCCRCKKNIHATFIRTSRREFLIAVRRKHNSSSGRKCWITAAGPRLAWELSSGWSAIQILGFYLAGEGSCLSFTLVPIMEEIVGCKNLVLHP